MCEQADIQGRKTNHSLRATGAILSCMRVVFPKKIIQERTGHRSLEALRVYEHKAVSSLLSAPSNSSYAAKMHSSIENRENVTHHAQMSAGLSFSNLYGCTININGMPSTSTSIPQSQAVSHQEHHEYQEQK